MASARLRRWRRLTAEMTGVAMATVAIVMMSKRRRVRSSECTVRSRHLVWVAGLTAEWTADWVLRMRSIFRKNGHTGLFRSETIENSLGVARSAD